MGSDWQTLPNPAVQAVGRLSRPHAVIAIGGYYYARDTNHYWLRDEVQQLQASQRARIKLKVGRATLAEDVARTQAVREAGGPDFVIACDANRTWTPAQAIACCQAVAPLGIRWVEEPVRWHDQLHGLRVVLEGPPLPVVACQGEITRWGCRDLIAHGHVNILNTDVTISGGITEWRRMAALASVFDVQMAHHEESQVALHLLAAIPHGCMWKSSPARTAISCFTSC